MTLLLDVLVAVTAGLIVAAVQWAVVRRQQSGGSPGEHPDVRTGDHSAVATGAGSSATVIDQRNTVNTTVHQSVRNVEPHGEADDDVLGKAIALGVAVAMAALAFVVTSRVVVPLIVGAAVACLVVGFLLAVRTRRAGLLVTGPAVTAMASVGLPAAVALAVALRAVSVSREERTLSSMHTEAQLAVPSVDGGLTAWFGTVFDRMLHVGDGGLGAVMFAISLFFAVVLAATLIAVIAFPTLLAWSAWLDLQTGRGLSGRGEARAVAFTEARRSVLVVVLVLGAMALPAANGALYDLWASGSPG